MLKTTLGRTGLTVNKDGFGALPVQRVDMDTATTLLRDALNAGIDFFDTARMYTDSEEKIGAALGAHRGRFTLATKTLATTVEGFWADLETSLALLKTDHVDIYQFHNPAACPLPGDGSGLYEAMLTAKQQGKIRFIGLTSHRMQVARQAVESGAYDTLQYPFSYLASAEEIALVRLAEEKNVGFIAMKALSGGLLTDVATSRAWLAQYKGVLPIWGIQRQTELSALLAAMAGDDTMTPQMAARIEADRAELTGAFCRGCGYCMPCPAGIEINNCARMSLMLRRAPVKEYTTPAWQEKMERVRDCTHCGQCAAKCPYGLDTPSLLQRNYEDFLTFV